MQINLTQAIRRARLIRPDEVAVIDGTTRLTWRNFSDRVARFAAALQDLGVSRGDRIAMLSFNSHRYLTFYLGTLWAGAVIMPLNHRLGANELSDLITDGEPSILVVSPEFAALGKSLAEGTSIRHLIWAADAPALGGFVDFDAALDAAEPAEEVPLVSDDLACLFYTGGTTGRPKGVMLSHGNIALNALNLIPQVNMDESVVHLHAGPLFHVAAGVRIYAVSMAAGTHVVAPRFILPDVLDIIDRERVTLATFVPTMLRQIMDDPALAGYELPSLRCITYGAAPMPVALLTAAIERFAHVDFVQSYGMTETSPIVSMLSARDHADPEMLASAGRPALTAEIRIAGPDGAEAAPGGTGEITVRGPMVMQGYWRNPQATAAAVKSGWFHTGDLGYLNERGYLFVVDRLKDVIISGGENIYSIEVEQVLQAHPAVAECAVFGLPDALWGERVHAVVVPLPGAVLDEDMITRHCRERIAGYKCPRSVEIRNEALPLSNVNKIAKTVLRDEAISLATPPATAVGEHLSRADPAALPAANEISVPSSS